MRPQTLTGAVVAIATMTAIPAWAGSDEVAGTEAKPGSSVERPSAEGGALPEGGATESMVPEAVATESNADMDIGEDGTHVRADSVDVDELDENNAEAQEDPAPEGYVTNVPAENVDDEADVGEATPAESTEPASDRLASQTPDTAEDAQTMKTSAEGGEYVEESPEEEQAAMANIDENEQAVEKAVASGEVVEAKPEENWFGCSDQDGSEGGTCENTGDAAKAPEGDVD